MNQGFNSATLSRCELSNKRTYSLQNPSYRTVATVVDMDGWQLVNTHITTDEDYHVTQVSELLSVLAPGEVVMTGDWNFNVTEPAYQTITNAGYTEAWVDQNRTGADSDGYNGYTNAEFDSRIDMIFSTSGISVSSVKVIQETCAVCARAGNKEADACLDCSASDHLAMIATLS